MAFRVPNEANLCPVEAFLCLSGALLRPQERLACREGLLTGCAGLF